MELSKAEFKVYDVEKETLELLSEAFKVDLKVNGESEWIEVLVEPRRTVTFFRK